MSETLSHAVPYGSRRTAGIAAGLFRLFVLSFLLFFSISLYAYPEADSSAAVSVDSSNAVADSVPGDSLRQSDAADSVIQRLANSRSGPYSDQKLDLDLTEPGSVFSAKNIGMVLVVIGLLVLFLHFLRKYLFKPVGGGTPGGQFQVIRQFHLGPKKTVALVRFAGRLLVLGITDSNINTLAEIDDPEEVERIISDAGASSDSPGTAFRDIYQNLLSRASRKPRQ